MMITIDTKNKQLQALIITNVNETLKEFKSKLLKSVNNMIITQLEIINNNMVSTIKATTIYIQASQVTTQPNNISYENTTLKIAEKS